MLDLSLKFHCIFALDTIPHHIARFICPIQCVEYELSDAQMFRRKKKRTFRINQNSKYPASLSQTQKNFNLTSKWDRSHLIFCLKIYSLEFYKTFLLTSALNMCELIVRGQIRKVPSIYTSKELFLSDLGPFNALHYPSIRPTITLF